MGDLKEHARMHAEVWREAEDALMDRRSKWANQGRHEIAQKLDDALIIISALSDAYTRKAEEVDNGTR